MLVDLKPTSGLYNFPVICLSRQTKRSAVHVSPIHIAPTSDHSFSNHPMHFYLLLTNTLLVFRCIWPS